jgi:hypothetical protein
MVSVASRVLPLSERRFFTGMALAMAAVTFVGFAPTYYLAAFNDGPRPLLSPSVHLHGALCTAWILLLILQTRLIASGRRALHKRLGVAGATIAAAVVVSGVFVALHSQRRVHTEATADTLADPYVFLIFPFSSVGLFAVFVALGVLNRQRADAHKRWMILATSSLIIPALARTVTQAVSGMGLVGVPGVVGALVLLDVFLVALAVYDYNTRGRLHPVTLWGGGFLLLSEPLRFAIGFSEPWQSFARAVMT